MSVAATITAATAAWRDALASQPEDWLASVEQGQREAGLTYKGSTVMTVAQPSFTTESTVAADQVTVDAVLAALVAAGEAVIEDPALRARYLGAWLESQPDPDLFALPTGYRDPIVWGRLDGTRSADGLHILEFNGGLPGGTTPADLSAQVMAGWPVAAEFKRGQPFRIMTAATDMIATITATWADYGGVGVPFVVIGLPRELTEIAASSLAYLATAAGAQGMELVVADPGELRHAAGRLRLADRPVDVLVRGFFTTMVEYLGPRLDGIRSALRAGDLCMITSMRSGLYGFKSLFAAITDPGLDLPLAPTTLATARAHLPWTRLAIPGPILTPDGSRTELLDYALAHRDQLVLKPMDGFGGAGVELGWNHTDNTWRTVLSAALGARGSVLQARVPLEPQSFSVLEPGFPVRAFTTDHNPIVCGWRIAGYYVRVTPNAGVTNVTTGAGIAPTFILPG